MDNIIKRSITSPLINFLGKHKEKRHFTTPPIFVGGCGRSGTTLLQSILSAHPKIFAFPNEVDAFTTWNKTDNDYTPVRQDRMYRELLWRKVPETAHRWCIKRPFNVLHIEKILSYFEPGTKFIHIYRDPRQVCVSRHPDDPTKYWVPLMRWIRDTQAGWDFRDHPQVLTINYNDLILDTEHIIRNMCDFLEEEAVDEIINWYEHATFRTNSAWFGKLENIQTRSLEKWKKPENKERVDEIMSDERVLRLMNELGFVI
jgi:hypothetical protein